MSNVLWLFVAVAAVFAAVYLIRALSARVSAKGIQKFNDQRRASCRLVSPGELIDGSRHIPVALAVNDRTLYYENADLSGSLDLEWVQEVEYDDELSTGRVVEGKVMRLRCSSQGFEFVLPSNVVAGWQAIVPSHRMAAL